MSQEPRTHFSLTSKILRAFLLLSLFLLLLPQQARADEIAVWNFNDSDLLVDHGSGTLSSNFVPTNLIFTNGGTTANARFGDIAGQSLTLQGGTSNTNNGRFLNLAVSTLGFTNIIISFATQATSSGFNSNQLQYSLDGLTFTNFAPPYAPPSSFGVFSFNLSSIPGLNDNPDAAFRIIFNGATSATGNNRIDNLVVDGQAITAVPEPSSVALLAMGLTGSAVFQLSRRRDHLRRCLKMVRRKQ